MGLLAKHFDRSAKGDLNSIVNRLNSNPLFGGPASMGGMSMATTITGAAGNINSVNLSSHAEQYRHYTGWVHSAVRVISQSISAQPIHVANAISASRKTIGGMKKRVDMRQKVFTPHGVYDKEFAGRQMWFKKVLPGTLKNFYESAELLESHPILDAINSPNPIMPKTSLMFVTVASLELTGKAYWWVEINKDPETNEGRPINIWYLPSHWCQPVHTKEKIFAAWKVIPDGSGMPFYVPVEHMVYFNQPDPSNPFGSYATLQAQARAVVTDEAISEAQRQSFQRGIFPGMAVVVGDLPEDSEGNTPGRPVLTKDQRQQIIQAIKRAYQGAYNADEPIILDRLIQDVKKLTNSPAEMNFMESGTYTKDKITQSFGVNPITMGAIQDVNKASAVAAKENLYDVSVNPRIGLLSDVLTNWISPLFSEPGEKLLMFIEECRASDPDTDRACIETLSKQGAVTRNEARAILCHLPPIPNGDTFFVQENTKLVEPDMTPEEFNAMTPKTSTGGKPLVDSGDQTDNQNNQSDSPVNSNIQ